jgi:class 3 adenylate cyclase/pimeloyl-ACP methyl ester carboxylesterase
VDTPETPCVPSGSPEIKYALSGDVSIAYAVNGEGPIDIVFVHGYISNLEVEWEDRRHIVFFERLASVGRVIRFDRRGSGLSDRVRDVPTLETRMDDLRAVMDAAGSKRAVVVATFEAASMTMLFAATYPERVAGLALYNPIAKGVWAPDYPFARTEEEHFGELEAIRRSWGNPDDAAAFLRSAAPSVADDPEVLAWTQRIFHHGASPGAALAIVRMTMNVDVRDVLPSIHVPTLIVHEARTRDEASYITERIPNARHVELGSMDRVFWLADGLPDQIVEFARTVWGEPEPETVLATVLFTDLVGSTAKAAELGDHAWADLLRRHHALVRAQLDQFRGRELDTAGDGFFATFDGPIRAIRCARTIGDAVHTLGLEIRAGLHTGECEVVGQKLGGLAVNIGARVAARAQPNEVLVTSTVKDLVAGSDLAFEDRGAAVLKGVPGEWRLYAVADAAA